MSSELVPYSAEAAIAVVTPSGSDYLVNCAGKLSTLKRDVDFGVIPKTKKPTLYKSGAEKICMGYGLLQQYEIETKIEQAGKDPFFFYNIKCNLVKVVNGVQFVLTSAYGSANTSESRNGFNGAFNAANNALKMAQKRALVAAALSISGLSDAFTQDMENEDFMNNAKVLLATDDPETPVSTAQIRRLYAIGGNSGLTANQVKALLAANGYASTKQILQKDYDNVCKLIEDSTNKKED